MFLAKSTHQKASICHTFSVGTITVRLKQTWKVISSTQTVRQTDTQGNYCNPSRMHRGLIIIICTVFHIQCACANGFSRVSSSAGGGGGGGELTLQNSQLTSLPLPEKKREGTGERERERKKERAQHMCLEITSFH